jgi:transposase
VRATNGNISISRSNLTPPQIAKRFGVSVRKVIGWIEGGELAALNLANRGCSRPRYHITEEAVVQFEQSRLVVPAGSTTTISRSRPVSSGGVKMFV